jgi:spore photoproduct lyase
MSISKIYIESEILKHTRVQSFISKFKPQKIIEIQKYTDVFNRKNQDFRVQKNLGQSLIIAKKRDNFVQETPEKCKLGIQESYYFSHLYNCPFDCEYCYLQGNYRSSNFVWFVNYANYFTEIESIIKESNQPKYFFSGFDCDSLALEGVTHFAEKFIPFFEKYENVSMELRTKSTNIQSLQKLKTPKNIVLAWTLSPNQIQKEFEKKTAILKQRIEGIQKMLKQGWRIGIRIEPMLYVQGWEKIFSDFFAKIVQEIDFSKIEDVSIGTLHLPKDMYKKMRKTMPESKLFTGPFELDNLGEMRYFKEIDERMKNLAVDKLKKVIKKESIFVS